MSQKRCSSVISVHAVEQNQCNDQAGRWIQFANDKSCQVSGISFSDMSFKRQRDRLRRLLSAHQCQSLNARDTMLLVCETCHQLIPSMPCPEVRAESRSIDADLCTIDGTTTRTDLLMSLSSTDDGWAVCARRGRCCALADGVVNDDHGLIEHHRLSYRYIKATTTSDNTHTRLDTQRGIVGRSL